MAFSDILRKIGIVIDPKPTEQGAEKAKKAIRGIGDETKKQGGAMKKVFGSVQGKIAAAFTVGVVISFFSTAIAAAGKYETALTSVLKVANFNTGQTALFRKEINELTKVIPRTSVELLGIAAAAGQLGVTGVENIVNFTETIAKLEVSSDIIGEQGAKSLARVLNITGESVGSIEKLADALVALGQKFAASESEITKMTLELSKATAQYGVSSRGAASLSAALVSLGQAPELAASSIGKTFRVISTALIEGGDNAVRLEKLMGRSAASIKKDFDKDSLGTVLEFFKGIDAAGERGTIVLGEFGLKGDEVAKTLPVLAKNLSEVTKAMDISAKSAGALDKEAAAAFATYESKIKLLGNAWTAFKVKVGDKLIPSMIIVVDDLTKSIERMQGALESASSKAEPVTDFLGRQFARLPFLKTKNIDNPDFFFNKKGNQSPVTPTATSKTALASVDYSSQPRFDLDGRPLNDAAVAIENPRLERENASELARLKRAYDGGSREKGLLEKLAGVGGDSKFAGDLASRQSDADSALGGRQSGMDKLLDERLKFDEFLSDGFITAEEHASNISLIDEEIRNLGITLDTVEPKLANLIAPPTTTANSAFLGGIKSEIVDLGTGLEQLQDLGRDTFSILGQGFSTGLSDMLSGTKSLKEGFSDMAKSILNDLSAMIIRQLVFNTISGIFGGGAVQFNSAIASQGIVAAVPVQQFHTGRTEPGQGGVTRDLMGGLRSNERPAILRNDELVLRPEDIERLPGSQPTATAPVINTSITISSDGTKDMDSQSQGFLAEDLTNAINGDIDKRIMEHMHPGGLLSRSAR